MKILLINKFWYQRGGSETYNFALIDALERMGHEVIFFGMKDERNISTPYEQYFVSNKDFNNNGIASKVNAAKDFFYSKEAAEKMELLINNEHPDIAHIGLIHRQLTFSIVSVLKKHNIPMVMTMHDLIFACPNYTMLNNGHVCEKCETGSSINCVRNKCIKNSYAKSLLGALEKSYLVQHRYYDYIDLYITECELYKTLFIKSKVTKSRIICKTNFLPINQEYKFNPDFGDYILYFGRFSKEKGIITLLKAHKLLKSKYKLILVGAGPIENEIKNYISKNKLTNIELPGPIYGEHMDEIIQKARVIVTPSEWYENCPYALLQSMARGKIEVVSNIGGLPELIKDNETGFLFNPRDPKSLANKIEEAMRLNREQYIEMSERIVSFAKESFGWEQYVTFLLNQYKKLLEDKKK